MPRHSESPPAPEGPSRLPGPLYLRPTALLLVALGGSLGTASRYGVGRVYPTLAGQWPVATFSVNIVGAFLLGFLLEGLTRLGPDSGWRQRTRLALGTGFLGSFTTYSALALDTDVLLRDGHGTLAVAYALATLLTGFLATAVGIVAGNLVRRSPVVEVAE